MTRATYTADSAAAARRPAGPNATRAGDRLPPIDRDWKTRYADRTSSAEAAIALIRRGDRILVGSGSAVPLGLLPALVSDHAATAESEILHLLTLGDAPYVHPRYEGRFRHNALFIGPNVRDAVTQGRADYTPVFLSEIPRLIRTRLIPIDVVLLSVSPPDEEGQCNLGPHVDIAPAAIDSARLVIAEVNPRLPRTFGASRVPVERITRLVELEHDLPEMHMPVPRAETEAIAANVARLVMDGATIQVGIGALPDAILRALANHHDLGVHTEMFSDGIVDLARRGVINGRKKTLHVGKIVASIVMGTRKVYDFIDENPAVEMYPVDYTNDPFVIARHDHMTAINTAIEVDLTGQVCSDSIGDRFYSGIGGQVDFIRGAARSNHGKPIICLPSTACDGNVSRIKPCLTDGAGVVTTRGDVHFVVTEWGAAYLHGKSVRERAMALIQIAHPKFRSWLLAEAKHRRFVYRNQAEPPVRTAVYPKELEWNESTGDGLVFRVRPIKPTDEAMLHEMFFKFTREEVYRRFFPTAGALPSKTLQQFCTIDYDNEMTLVATMREHVLTRVIGLALYVPDGQTGFAKAGFVVADALQGRGVGSRLIQRLVEVARSRGLAGFTMEVPAENRWIRPAFERWGSVREEPIDGPRVQMRLTFHTA